KLSTTQARCVLRFSLLIFLSGCATTRDARLPLEPDNRWALETPEKSPAPVDSPSRCFFRHVVTLAMKTSLQSCAPSGHAIVLASAKAPALIKPGEMDYAAGSRF